MDSRGLVGEVVSADDLASRLLDYCEQIAQQAPLAVRQTKQLVARTPLVTDVEQRVRHEIQLALRGLNSSYGQEAVLAIM